MIMHVNVFEKMFNAYTNTIALHGPPPNLSFIYSLFVGHLLAWKNLLVMEGMENTFFQGSL